VPIGRVGLYTRAFGARDRMSEELRSHWMRWRRSLQCPPAGKACGKKGQGARIIQVAPAARQIQGAKLLRPFAVFSH